MIVFLFCFDQSLLSSSRMSSSADLEQLAEIGECAALSRSWFVRCFPGNFSALPVVMGGGCCIDSVVGEVALRAFLVVFVAVSCRL